MFKRILLIIFITATMQSTEKTTATLTPSTGYEPKEPNRCSSIFEAIISVMCNCVRSRHASNIEWPS